MFLLIIVVMFDLFPPWSIILIIVKISFALEVRKKALRPATAPFLMLPRNRCPLVEPVCFLLVMSKCMQTFYCRFCFRNHI